MSGKVLLVALDNFLPWCTSFILKTFYELKSKTSNKTLDAIWITKIVPNLTTLNLTLYAAPSAKEEAETTPWAKFHQLL